MRRGAERGAGSGGGLMMGGVREWGGGGGSWGERGGPGGEAGEEWRLRWEGRGRVRERWRRGAR